MQRMAEGGPSLSTPLWNGRRTDRRLSAASSPRSTVMQATPMARTRHSLSSWSRRVAVEAQAGEIDAGLERRRSGLPWPESR